jgi:hypothetical protein
MTASLIPGPVATTAVPPVLRLACAWCGRELRPGVEPTSHGICDPCAKDFLIEAGLA